MESQARSHIVVGVVPGQPSEVFTTAACYAKRFDADLVFAFVDATRYSAEWYADGTTLSMPIDPDLADEREAVFDPELRDAIAAALKDKEIVWSTRAMTGGPALELARLADELDARMIVVGTRRPGFRGTLREFLNGSVGAQLAHRQHRPLVVVPLDPVDIADDQPWGPDSSETAT